MAHETSWWDASGKIMYRIVKQYVANIFPLLRRVSGFIAGIIAA